MPPITAQNAANQDFMPLMRELVRAYQAFAGADAALHRLSGSGLTVSQADVIFTLGNTQGMSCSEIGDKTLITKGTLTGVIDRLEDKGLVARCKVATDGRCVHVRLTEDGRQVFETYFPGHVSALKAKFDQLEPATRDSAIKALAEIRRIFS